MCFIFRSGYSFVTFSLEPKAFLPRLMKEFTDIGGVINYPVKVKSLAELRKKYDIVINCAGLDGGRLADDSSVTPVRGQVARVKQNLFAFIFHSSKENIQLSCFEIMNDTFSCFQ